MNTDRELLEMAAEAAGVAHDPLTKSAQGLFVVRDYGVRQLWNPLTDDGAALRLVVKLRLGLIPLDGGGWDVVKHDEDGNERTLASCANSGDWAVRDCIVRAAAEIGRSA